MADDQIAPFGECTHYTHGLHYMQGMFVPVVFCKMSNYSGPNQYFPRNRLFFPPKGERTVCFALKKWLA